MQNSAILSVFLPVAVIARFAVWDYTFPTHGDEINEWSELEPPSTKF